MLLSGDAVAQRTFNNDAKHPDAAIELQCLIDESSSNRKTAMHQKCLLEEITTGLVYIHACQPSRDILQLDQPHGSANGPPIQSHCARNGRTG
eukprot:scaffold175899_cov22-Prasinocladus_malaysianus.AAC.1